VFAQQSNIKGAGMGAFLKYVGAKKLNTASKELNESIFENTTIHVDCENLPLQAQLENGGATVHLKGAGLDEHGRKYCSNHDLVATIKAKSLRRGSTFKAGLQKVRIHIEGIPSSLDKKAYFIEDENRRVGYLGIHLESDYKWAPGIQFPVSDETVIDLGRYGPFRKLGTFNSYLDRLVLPCYFSDTFVTDRKPDELFHLKVSF
jgi:hypothetical protein